MGFTEILAVVFIVLKLTGKIDWNWFYVLLPEIIGFAYYLFYLIVAIVSRYKLDKIEKDLFK